MSPFFLRAARQTGCGSRRDKPGFAGARRLSVSAWTLEPPDEYGAFDF